MKTELELKDLKAVAFTTVEILTERLKEIQHNSLLDAAGLAEYLKVPRSWVYEKTRDKGNGSIPRMMVGKYVRFNIHDVLEWLSRQ